MELKGVYNVAGHKDVHLIELVFEDTPENVDVGKITQEILGHPHENWQTPWDEKYLDENGEKVIGDCFNIPKHDAGTRLIFYFHFLGLILRKGLR